MIDPVEIRPSSKAETWKTIRWLNGSRKQVVVRIVDEEGRPVDLAKEPENIPAAKPRFGYQTEVAAGTVAIRLLVLDEVPGEQSNRLLLDVLGELIPDSKECLDCKGVVEFKLEAGQDFCPGIYKAQISRFVHGGYQVDAYPAYLAIEPNLLSQFQARGMITLPEIRAALGDSTQGEVNLLDSFEFDDTEIAMAIRWVVDRWNNTPPPVNTYSYFNFPFRYWWLKGTCIELMRMAAKRYARNRLAYQAGGITIDDQNKSAEYEQIAAREFQEFDEWFKMEKRRQNMDRAWSTNYYL